MLKIVTSWKMIVEIVYRLIIIENTGNFHKGENYCLCILCVMVYWNYWNIFGIFEIFGKLGKVWNFWAAKAIIEKFYLVIWCNYFLLLFRFLLYFRKVWVICVITLRNAYCVDVKFPRNWKDLKTLNNFLIYN